MEYTPGQRMIEDRQIGHFFIDDELVNHRPSDVQKLLEGLIVIRCEHRVDMLRFEYHAYGPAFAPAPKYGLALDYAVVVNNDSIHFVPHRAKTPEAPWRHESDIEILRKEEIERRKTMTAQEVYDEGQKARERCSWDERKAQHERLLEAGGDFAYAAASGAADVELKEARYRRLQLAVEKAEHWRTPVDDRNGGRR